MKRAGLGVSALLATGMAIFAGCTGEDPVLSDTSAPDAGPALSPEDGGPAADGVAPSADAGADAQAPRISLAGKLVTNHDGTPETGLFVPLSGPAVSLYIAGKKVPSIGPGGTFAVNDVETPYDAFVVETNATVGTRVSGYLGLTRPDPMLFGGVEGRPTFEAYAMGTLGTAPIADQLGFIAVGGDDTDGICDETTTATYSQGRVHWASDPAPQVQAAAYVATFNSNTDLPTFFSAYGVTPPYVPIAGGAPAMKDILMNQVFNASVHLEINLPPTFAIFERFIVYHPAGGPTFRVGALDPKPTTLDFGLPSNASGEVRLRAQPAALSGADDVVGLVIGALAMGSRTVTVPPIATRLTAPTLGTIFAGTPIAWSATPSSVYRFLMFSSSIATAGYTGDSLVFRLYSASGGAPMPDLTKLGVTLPSGKYTARIEALGPFSSLDAVCGPDVTKAYQSYSSAAGISLTAP